MSENTSITCMTCKSEAVPLGLLAVRFIHPDYIAGITSIKTFGCDFAAQKIIISEPEILFDEMLDTNDTIDMGYEAKAKPTQEEYDITF